MCTAARRWSLRAIFILSVPVLFAFAGFELAAAQVGQPEPITEEADKMHDLYLFVTVIAGIVAVAVEAALIFAIVRYRKKNDELPAQTHGNNAIEILWTAIPIVIVVILFVASFMVLVDVEDEAPPEALTIDMQGFQFQWAGTYTLKDIGPNADRAAEGAFTVRGLAGEENEPEFLIPIGEQVEFKLHSEDVIHSFYVRNFLYKLDVVPGRNNSFQVTAHTLGTFEGQCAELCGTNHALMRFTIKVVTRQEFDQWVAKNIADGQAAARQPDTAR